MKYLLMIITMIIFSGCITFPDKGKFKNDIAYSKAVCLYYKAKSKRPELFDCKDESKLYNRILIYNYCKKDRDKSHSFDLCYKTLD